MNKKIDWKKWDATDVAIKQNTDKMYQRWSEQNKKRPTKYTYTQNSKSFEPCWIIKALSWLVNGVLDVFIFGALLYFVLEIVPQLIESIPVTYK